MRIKNKTFQEDSKERLTPHISEIIPAGFESKARGENADNETTQKYLTVASLINGIEDRLKWSELVFILLNLIVFFPTINFLSPFVRKTVQLLTPMDMLFVFFCLVIGISINTYWTASSMRLQIKLKLRYFQARFLERKLNRTGEFLFSDESLFFNPTIRQIKSPDGEETTYYPTKGFLRMDGFVGSAKPRHLSLLMPFMFFAIYLISFFGIVIRLFLS
jgi:hypothetical protein